jgi:hypothetical protein
MSSDKMNGHPSKEQSSDKEKPNDTGSGSGGEDESSTEKNGDDSHLHDDQKAPSL